MFTIKLHKKKIVYFCSWYSQYLMKCCMYINVRHNSTYVFPPPLSHCSGFAGGQGALPSPSQNSHCLLAALLAMPALASSSARSSLIIAHSCFALRSRMVCCSHGCGIQVRWHFIEYLTTALVLLYFAGTSRENPRYYALLALFAWFALGRRKWLQTDD